MLPEVSLLVGLAVSGSSVGLTTSVSTQSYSPAPPVSTPTLSLRGQQAAPAMKGTGTARRNNKKSTASNKEEKCICEICTCG